MGIFLATGDGSGFFEGVAAVALPFAVGVAEAGFFPGSPDLLLTRYTKKAKTVTKAIIITILTAENPFLPCPAEPWKLDLISDDLRYKI